MKWTHGRDHRRERWIVLALVLLLSAACGHSNPLDRLAKELDIFPAYSVVLHDMKEGGNITDEYYHQYRVVWGEHQAGTDELEFHDRIDDWVPVSRDHYNRYQDYLGMTVLAKDEDGVDRGQQPAGYRYVGNPRYGEWRTDSSGGSFWSFYGKYVFLSRMFDTYRRPIYRSDWDDYRSHRNRGQPYFGPSRQYGTRGTATQTTHRSFFERQQARQQTRNQRFSDKVQQRVKRSRMSGTRSRSSGRGGK